MNLVINPNFIGFLDALRNKPEGQAICFYNESIDFLTVIMGDGALNDWDTMYIGTIILDGVDVIRKNFPENEDDFAGIKIWGGVRGFMSQTYYNLLGKRYEEFRLMHNARKNPFAVAEIVKLLLEDPRFPPKEIWRKLEGRVMRALKEQNPKVHIPLIPIK
ncbi:MAG: hypothetical protein AAB858_01580 [Patescibacteria group bacterium]|mgnify:CR=1 FL=1